MAQCVNRLRNNIFVNPPPLPLSCEISGALHLVQPGLTATEIQHHYSLTNAFQQVFWIKLIARDFKAQIFGKPYDF